MFIVNVNNVKLEELVKMFSLPKYESIIEKVFCFSRKFFEEISERMDIYIIRSAV